MARVSILEVSGPDCGTYADGEKVSKAIALLLRSKESVQLDFAGVRVVSSSFFNGVIGESLQTFGEENLLSRLSFLNMKGQDKFVFERTLNSIRKKRENVIGV